MNAMSATSTAVPAASALNRVVSPPAIPPNEAPMSSEIADVTVIAVCRELQNSQKTSPPNKTRVKSCFRRQVGERSIAEPGGQKISRERDARHQDHARNQAGW